MLSGLFSAPPARVPPAPRRTRLLAGPHGPAAATPHGLAAATPHGLAAPPQGLSAAQAAYVALHIALALADRPLSVANTPFVVGCLRALAHLQAELSGMAAALEVPERKQAQQLAEMLRRFLAAPDPAGAQRISRFVAQDMPLYARAVQSGGPERPLAAGALEHCRAERLVVMIGPGIGIGDEIKLHFMIAGLQQALRIAPALVTLHSFCPAIWRTLLPGCQVSDLSRAPLAAFRQAMSEPRTLTLFASFLEHHALRLLPAGAPDGTAGPAEGHVQGSLQGGTALALTLANCEVRLRSGGVRAEQVVRRLHVKAPSYTRAVMELTCHLCPSLHAAAAALPQAPAHAGAGRDFSLVISPFTSKTHSLTPGDWADFMLLIRRAIPPARRLDCQILPGLSPSCRDFAQNIQALAQARLGKEDRAALLDANRPPLNEADAFAAIFAALRKADLLLSIDTYTAHLAAHAGVVTMALCLNRNVHFWDTTPYSIWLDTTRSRDHVAVLIRTIAGLVAREDGRGGPLADLLARAPRLIAAASMAALAADRAAMAALSRQGEAIWAGLPEALRRSLLALDAEYAWPVLRPELTGAQAERRQLAWQQLGASQFWRMTWLAAMAGRQGQPAAVRRE